MDIIKILKFIFPEYQIIQAIRYQRNMRTKDSFSNQNAFGSIPVSANDFETESISAPLNRRKSRNNKTSVFKGADRKNTDSLTFKNKIKKNKSTYSFENFKKAYSNSIENFIGQNSAVYQLVNAFRRPYVVGVEGSKPKNTIFLLGKKGFGRNTMVNTVVRSLSKLKILNYSAVSKLDLSLYETLEDSEIFMSDLFKCLYKLSEVVVVSNFKKCHARHIDILSHLITEGSYKLDNRYILSGGKLIKATGSLIKESISAISANNKYFIFLTDQSEIEISEFWGTKFMKHVGDIIELDEYTSQTLKVIIKDKIKAVESKCKQNLDIKIENWEEIEIHCFSKYSDLTGVEGLERYIDESIYSPLAEYVLQSNDEYVKRIKLSVVDNGIFIYESNNESFRGIPLSDFMPKKYNNLASVKEELNNIIGLDKVKEYVLSLENNYAVQKRRQEQGYKEVKISNHMIFSGNPGTGKTMIARVVAKYLKEIGILSIGQLREVSRADLVGKYLGHTAKQCNDVIKSALGGVLFIDEAYSLYRDKHDTFGLEAIDALVKGIEDNKDNLVVIMAGYENEMEKFLEINPGLKSRFPNEVKFDDYTSDQMIEISNVIAKEKGYSIASNCVEGLMELFDNSQIKGKNDSGNGRLARNVVESAILKQSKRLAREKDADMGLLTTEDFGLNEQNQFNIEIELSKVVGLDTVKDFIRTQQKLLIAAEKRKNAGVDADIIQSMNIVFAGNPGTGKTMMARLLAQMFKDMGALKKGHLVEVDKSNLVSEYVGRTATKTTEVFKSALGGVLFIDEAYSLADSRNGKEAINTLVKLIEDYRSDIVVILAGYKKEMKEFMKSNSGLSSRFPINIDFPDYSSKELLEIANRIIMTKGFRTSDDAKIVLKKQIEIAHKSSNSSSGNGRMVRNLIEKILRNQSARIATSEVEFSELSLIEDVDIVDQTKFEEYDLEEELNNIIGLDKVKEYVLSLENNYAVQKRRQEQGYKEVKISNHMIFSGNPGTGKTMIARVVAKCLKEIGILSIGQLREVSRADLVGKYLGHTAKQCNDVIESALGGVLFIDEAYSLCRDKHDIFGLEAIDALVKGIEDNKDNLVVIMAGYENEMEKFLEINPGLKSRFPNEVKFDDYTSDQMIEISNVIAKEKGYSIASNCVEGLMELFDNSQIKGKNDSGNGRLARNVVESAILKQSKRLAREKDADMGLLTTEDFGLNEQNQFNIEIELSKVVGLDTVKDFIRTQQKLLIAAEKRKNAGVDADIIQSMNIVFAGNPGTGKTMMARLLAQMFKDMGALKKGHLVEVDKSNLVSEYVGRTATKTTEVFKSALGGVLFIDEAYSLADSRNGKEAINTLVKLIEDYRSDIVVILAGYKKEMKEFMKSNSGLSSRFPINIDFPDYSSKELLEIANRIIMTKGFRTSDDAKIVLKKQIEIAHKSSNSSSGNGRMVRNLIEKILRNQSARIATSEVEFSELSLIEDVDIVDQTKFEEYDLEEELNNIIGLTEVKNYVRRMSALIRMQKERKKMGLTVEDSHALHMIFKGNPGTGKTMIARILADVLYNIGVLSTNKLVETDRSGLVAGYIGQTAIKTREKVNEALDGILFIDEAYSLWQGGPKDFEVGTKDFGREAIDTLVKMMDDNRHRLVVILAGYENEMNEFMKSNSGLSSRFPINIDFPDYSSKELFEIANRIIMTKGFHTSDNAKIALEKQIEIAHKSSSSSSGNGRMVRNLIEKILRNQAARIATSEEGYSELSLIEDVDIVDRTKFEEYDLEEELNNIIGLTEVKNYVRRMSALIRIQKEREKMGLTVEDSHTLHMIFKGNPGTGKTMIARILADVLHNIGVLSTNKLVETDRSGLVAGYIGQTAIKTREKVNDALDGILFIDEAYSLAQGGPIDFGREAIDTLVKMMDDNRHRLVVVLAGYSDDMDRFIDTNLGLKSRFTNVIDFPDYNVNELMQIAKNIYSKKGYELGEDAIFKLKDVISEGAKESAFGNGRYVRNLVESSIKHQAYRLREDSNLTKEDLITIEHSDIREVK